MISIHAIYNLTLIAQATTATALGILACNERRLSGLWALATACGLHAVAIFVMPMWRGSNRWVPEAVSAAFLPTIFLLIHEGLGALLRKRKEHSDIWRAFVGFSVVVVVAVAPWSQLWSMQFARVAGVMVIGRTVWMLWRTKPGITRAPALITAALLASALLTFIVRLPIEPRVSPSAPLLVSLREMSMVEISLLAFSFLALYQAELKRILHEETRRDVLTGLLNRRAVEELASEHTLAAERTGSPLAMLMMDIDHFKALNDRCGHPFGDQALRSVASTLNQVVPATGASIARLSGEEFVILLPDSSASTAYELGEKIRAAIEDLEVDQDGQRARLTVSIGAAVRHAGESTWSRMLRRADTALYKAKRGGRNCVIVCDEVADVRSWRSDLS